jgi:hypothetical protein
MWYNIMMNNRLAIVESAIAHAPLYELPGDLQATVIQASAPPPDASHDYPVVLSDYDKDALPPHWLPAETPGEFKDLLLTYYEAIGHIIGKRHVRVADRNVLHEDQHRDGVSRLGPHEGRFMLEMARFRGLRGVRALPSFAPYGLKTTKLGEVIVATRPEKLSEYDLQYMHSRGYGSVAQVGRLALERGMPVPLSLQKGFFTRFKFRE